jgi:HPt (histidine-containing phosphotransfer) domain-containing protein
VDCELDLERLAELQRLLGTDLPEIIATLVRELSTSLAATTQALETGDLDGAALAVHAARNSALMIDAQPLLDRLGELETCARAGDLAGSIAAHERLLQAWPSLQRRLELAATGVA